MAVTVRFYAGEDFTINDLSGSGLGFYGTGGFASSIPVGEWNSYTYITNATGTAIGPQADNVAYLNSASGILGPTSGSGVALTVCPNHQATIRIDVISDTPIQTQNTSLRIYDRSNINNPPSGVTCKVAEIIHPNTTQDNTGSGDTAWTTAAGSGSVLSLVDSPGASGLWANGAGGRSDSLHSYYVAISASPDSIGSKSQFALWFSTEYF